MPMLVRIVSALALAALVALVPVATTSAAKPKAAAWAKKHKLTGNWRAKDADKDGLKNFAEYKQGTNPRKADTDRDGLKDGHEVASGNDPLDRDTDGDGVKDGDEHAGVVTSFDGETITIRQFNGPVLTALVDDACEAEAAASFVDVEETEDPGWEDDEPFTDEGEEEVDLGSDEDCDLADVAEDDVLTSAELEIVDGETYVVAVEIA